MPPVKWDQIHFIGFNALNNCEKEMMTSLKSLVLPDFTGTMMTPS